MGFLGRFLYSAFSDWALFHGQLDYIFMNFVMDNEGIERGLTKGWIQELSLYGLIWVVIKLGDLGNRGSCLLKIPPSTGKALLSHDVCSHSR